MINIETISKRLEKIINESGLSRSEVASKAGCTSGAISHWIKGRRNINLIDYINICRACGVSNGVFEMNSMSKNLPSEVSQQAEDLISVLLEVHELVGDPSDTPFDVFLDNAKNLRDLIVKSMKAISSKQHKKEVIDFVAEESPNYKAPEEAFHFSTENELKTLKLVKDTMTSIRKFDRACAGNAGYINDDEAELLPFYVDGYKGRRNITLLEVSGDSMAGMIEDGDILVVENFDKPIFISSEHYISLSDFQKQIKHGDLCVINLDNHGQEVKQICYSGSNDSWGLTIRANNPEWEDRVLHKGQTLCIYGLVLGKAEINS